VTVAVHLGLLAEEGSEAWDAARQCPSRGAQPDPAPRGGKQQHEGQHAAGGTRQTPPAQQQQPQQHPSRHHPSVAAMVAEHPSAAGIYLSNLLCTPRLTLLWHWLTGEWRSALAAAVGSGGGRLRGGGGGGGGGDQDAGHEGWRAVHPELAMLKVGAGWVAGQGRNHLWSVMAISKCSRRASLNTLCCAAPVAQTLQHLAAHAGPVTNGAAAPPPKAAAAAPSVTRLVSPPFGGSDWEWLRFWVGWLAAPGVLVALQVVGTSSHEPWFVVHVAWLGKRAPPAASGPDEAARGALRSCCLPTPAWPLPAHPHTTSQPRAARLPTPPHPTHPLPQASCASRPRRTPCTRRSSRTSRPPSSSTASSSPTPCPRASTLSSPRCRRCLPRYCRARCSWGCSGCASS
jgi:hypothetical protein